MSTTDANGSRWKNQVLVNELPEDFLRVGGSVQEQQVMTDERLAQILQAQQQAGVGMVPANLAGRLSLSVIQAKLAKNYGITKMDPYCRIRIGHAVFETPTAYNGAKNPRWNKMVSCYIPHGVKNLYIEIFDERSFTVDDRIAWAYITIPEDALTGGTIDEWFPLSGKQGDEKEGMINLIFSFTPANALPATSIIQASGYSAPLVYQYPPSAVLQPVYPMQQQQQPMQPPRQQRPGYTEADFKQVKDMFPNLDDEIILSVFAANSGNKDATINSLLSMSAE
ncbi:hypothetical protein ACJMK2_027989 [Sinanodonta woodiana]|uniref:Toll-interacting protein n=1 Tax=Sinanodonta woodiana TaxID=1069815 RepID=A0ABD3X9K6_SINWO